MDRGAWWATVYEVTKSWTWLSDYIYLLPYGGSIPPTKRQTVGDLDIRSLGVQNKLIIFHMFSKRILIVLLIIKIIAILMKKHFSSVQSLSRVRLFATPWITALQASLSLTNSPSSLRLTSIKSVMPSSHLILRRLLLLLPPIPPNIRVFSNESTLRMRWPKYWSFSFSIIPSKEIPCQRMLGLLYNCTHLTC